MKEHDFEIEENLTPEEIEARDEEYARRVSREVRYMKSERGDRDEEEGYEDESGDIDGRDGREDRDESGERGGREWRGEDGADKKEGEDQKSSVTWWLFSGNVLLSRGITKYYGQMVIVAALFLLSIIVMFWSLHLDMSYNSLVRDVQLLRERSVRLQEVRFSRCSHSSIVEELERRGINLVDPTTPATVIEGSW